ncbi:MAG: hypothetical protein ACRD4K_04075 [Candidatus Acidiferrales bacterium]
MAAMRVGSVAIGAFGERNRLFEISTGMTFQAIHLGMFAEQREFCFGVIEVFVARDSFPTGSDVAGGASFSKPAVMRIIVAIGTFCKCKATEFGSLVRSYVMALGAEHGRVKAGEWKSCLGMVELLGRFPIGEIMTLCAIRSELALVNILVASDAILR